MAEVVLASVKFKIIFTNQYITMYLGLIQHLLYYKIYFTF